MKKQNQLNIILSQLKKLEERNGTDYRIELYSNGSGYIYDFANEVEIYDFGALGELSNYLETETNV